MVDKSFKKILNKILAHVNELDSRTGGIEFNPAAVSLASGTSWTTIVTYTIPKTGLWLVSANCSFGNNSSGRRGFGISHSNNTAPWGLISQSSVAAVSGAGTTLATSVYVRRYTKGTVLYFVAYQTSGSALNATPRGNFTWLGN